jgi:hypothetical protein
MRGLGKALSQIELAKAAPGNQYARVDRFHAGTGPTYLRDLGITKQAPHRAQFIASLPRKNWSISYEISVPIALSQHHRRHADSPRMWP